MYKHYPHHDRVSIAPLLCCCALSLTLLLALFFSVGQEWPASAVWESVRGCPNKMAYIM